MPVEHVHNSHFVVWGKTPFSTESLSLAEVAGKLDRETLQRLKRECGGLQTLLRNSHQVFEGKRIKPLSVLLSQVGGNTLPVPPHTQLPPAASVGLTPPSLPQGLPACISAVTHHSLCPLPQGPLLLPTPVPWPPSWEPKGRLLRETTFPSAPTQPCLLCAPWSHMCLCHTSSSPRLISTPTRLGAPWGRGRGCRPSSLLWCSAGGQAKDTHLTLLTAGRGGNIGSQGFWPMRGHLWAGLSLSTMR